MTHPYDGIHGHVIWTVQVDWDGNGAFDDGDEPQAMSKMVIKRGRGKRMRGDGLGQLHPGDESFAIEIIDSAARYDSFNTSSPIYAELGMQGLLLRVLVFSTTTEAAAEVVFVGVLESVVYDHATGVATLSGSGLSRKLELGAAESLYAPVQSMTDGGWDAYFDEASGTPAPINYWKGRPGGLALHECVEIALERAGDPIVGAYGVAGTEEPDYFYLDGASAWDTITDLADGFCARLFFTRAGVLFVMDRGDTVGMAKGLSAPTRAQRKFGLEREIPFEVRNRVEVSVRPHYVHPLIEFDVTGVYWVATWSNSGPLVVPPNSTLDLLIRYPDTLGKPIQGSFACANTNLALDPNRHEVWSAAGETGTDMGVSTGNGEASFTVLKTTTGGFDYITGNNQKYCTAHFHNTSAVRTAYFTHLQVQLIGIIETGNRFLELVEDAASQALNGVRGMQLNSRWIQNQHMAEDIGQAYMDALSVRERASVASIVYQWSGDALYENLVKYDLGSHVDFGALNSTTSLANYGLTNRWLIVGQELQWLSADGQDAFVRLAFERVAPTAEAAAFSNQAGHGGWETNTLAWNMVINAGDNRLLTVIVAKRAIGAVTSVTFNGVAMTLLGATQYGSGTDAPRVEMWYLLAPPVGTYQVLITLPGNDRFVARAVSFANVSQVAPFGEVETATGASGTNASTTVVSETSGLVLDGLSHRASIAATPGAGQTSVFNMNSDGFWRGQGSYKAGASSVTMGWTMPAEMIGWAQVVVAIRSAGS